MGFNIQSLGLPLSLTFKVLIYNPFLLVLYYIFSVALLPSKQEGYFIIAPLATIRLLKTFIILFFNTVVLFRYNLTYIRL